MAKQVSQKRFVKGINNAVGTLSQQPGSLTRMSNLLLTQRGSLQTCDGSTAVCLNPTSYNEPLAFGTFNNYSVSQYLYYLSINTKNPPGVSNFTTYTVSVSGGSGLPTDYQFALVAWDNTFTYHNTPVYVNVPYLLGATTVTATFTIPAGGYQVRLYYVDFGFPSPSVYFEGSSTTSTISVSITTTTPATLPGVNNSYSSQLLLGTGTPSQSGVGFSAVSSTPYVGPTVSPIALAPGDPNAINLLASPGYSPYGGISGTICPIPQIIQFAGKSILALGNGVAPQSIDPSVTTPTPSNLTNSFQASYPSWQSGVSWITDSQLAAGGYVFTAIQGGVSGTTTPSWNYTINAQTADGSVIWSCTSAVATVVAPRGAAHATAYAGSLWLANTSPSTTSDQLDGPTVIKMSQANNQNSWNPVNTAFIGRDDGTQITGMQPFTIAALGISPTGSMAVFKEYQTYQIIGVFGSNNFEIQEAQTDMGCIAARTIQFIPGFGVVRYTHLGFSVYDGVNDKLISEEIKPYLVGGVYENSDIVPVDSNYLYFSKSAQSVNPAMYLCAMPLEGGNGALTRMFCYDLVMKSWIIIDLPWSISVLSRVETGEGYPLILAGQSGTGVYQRIQAGDTNWDSTVTNVPVNWSFRTPDVYGEGSSQRIFYRQMAIRGYSTTGNVGTITVTPTLDGAVQQSLVVDVVPQSSNSNQFEARVNLWLNGQICHLDIAGSGSVVIDSIDWSIEEKSATARRVIG